MGTGAFSGCSKLQKIIIPKGITKIEDCTFTNCNKLEEIIFKDTITEISNYAYTNCKALTTYAIPIGVAKIGKEIFQGCNYLEKLYIPNTVEEIQSIGNSLKSAIIYCKSETAAEEYLKENGFQYQLDNQKPVLYNTYTYLNKQVNITIRTIEPVVGIEGWESSIGNKKLTKTYTENTNETITISDFVGNTTSLQIQIDGIENEIPQITIETEINEVEDTQKPEIQVNYKKQGEETLVTIISNEVLQELNGWEMKEDGKALNKIYQGETKETIEIKDLAGNISYATIDIGKLILEVEYSIKEITLEEVIVSIKSNRELKKIEGWELSTDNKILTKSFTENVNKYITVEDFSGNVEYADIFISNIIKNGDANKDGKIDITDILIVLRHISAQKSETIKEKHPDWTIQDIEFADVNSDKTINITDVLTIQRHIAAQKSETIKEKHPEWLIL